MPPLGTQHGEDRGEIQPNRREQGIPITVSTLGLQLRTEPSGLLSEGG